MLDDFLPLVAALVLAGTVYLLRERHRRRILIRPSRPDLSLRETWELWRAGKLDPPDRRFLPPAFHPSAETQAQVAGDLADLPDLTALRREILRSATAALYLESILRLGEPEREALLQGYRAGMEPVLHAAIAACTLRWFVLRGYAALKFDDAAPDDWFHHYMDLAGPYIREKERLARDFLLELDSGAARLLEIYDEMLRELANRLQRSPRKQRFVHPGLK